MKTFRENIVSISFLIIALAFAVKVGADVYKGYVMNKIITEQAKNCEPLG